MGDVFSSREKRRAVAELRLLGLVRLELGGHGEYGDVLPFIGEEDLGGEAEATEA